MFIFRGASRDEQTGVASKPSPAVASVAALFKRCYMRKRDNRIEPVAATPDAATPNASVPQAIFPERSLSPGA
jgi:hypothetical protein